MNDQEILYNKLDYRDYKELPVWKFPYLEQRDLDYIHQLHGKRFHKFHRNCRDQLYRKLGDCCRKYSVHGNILSLSHIRIPWILSALGDYVDDLFTTCEINNQEYINIRNLTKKLNRIRAYKGITFEVHNRNIFQVAKDMRHSFSIIDLDLMKNITSKEQAFDVGNVVMNAAVKDGFTVASVTTGLGRKSTSTVEFYNRHYRKEILCGMMYQGDKKVFDIVEHQSYGYRDPKNKNGRGGIPQRTEICVLFPYEPQWW